ncbi:hypothetical protein P3T23_003322 [Paraburkholderia sp. GAS448]|jgi:hypothetical protein|uniref:hypothetical protein n=1 Tax=Paraburkholderia sp. GAS448 TaxID=3035136 RepID=UPI003D229BD6
MRNFTQRIFARQDIPELRVRLDRFLLCGDPLRIWLMELAGSPQQDHPPPPSDAKIES